MSLIKKTMLVSTMIVASLVVTACGMSSEEVASSLKSSEVGYEDANKEADKQDTQEEAKEKTVTRELYLIDKDGYVVPQAVELPQDNSAAKQVLEYLVEDGPVSEILPNGFRAVLPAGTTMTVDVQKDVAIVDFSNEVKEYKAADEQKILQAVTWTLTQFDNINSVKVRINGYDQTEMPVAKTPIGNGLTRASGINFDSGDVVDITNTRAVTLYFLSQSEEGDTYYVPVTRRVNASSDDMVETVVNELIKGPSINSSLLTDFDPDIKLLDVEKKDGEVTLNFNEYVLGSSAENMISDDVLQSLVLSLTEQQGIESVTVKVNGESDIVNDKGEKISEAVTRPEVVNAGKY